MAKFTNFHPLNRKERIALIVLLSIFAIFSVAGIASFNSKTVDSKTYTSLEEIVERKYYYKQKKASYRSNYKYTNAYSKDNYSNSDYPKSKTSFNDTVAFSQSDYTNDFKSDEILQQKYELSPFDPNTVSDSTLLAMGLPEYWVASLAKYRAKGGSYRKAVDVKKVYGTTEQLFNSIEPFIYIDAKGLAKLDSLAKRDTSTMATMEKVYETIELNSASAEQLDQLPGIGPSFANRILEYRDKLGGYTNPDQLLEVYKLTPEMYTKIQPYLTCTPSLKLININTATEKELSNHPYISYKIAKVILNYKAMHGPFATIEDVKSIKAISAADYAKISQYLSVD